MPRCDVAVVGSANIDHVVRLARAPDAGETVAADGYRTGVGGKGLNQAVAAARAGARTAFVGAVGDDAPGRGIAAALDDDLIAHDGLQCTAAPTGSAHVFVDHDGGNRIAVVAGANGLLDADRAAGLLARWRPSVVLVQLEIPRAVVLAAARAARTAGARVVLTPAPLDDGPLDPRLLDATTTLALNEPEARTLAGGADPTDALLRLVPEVVLTRGADGATYADRTGTRLTVPAHPVRPLDTTGAGDTFVGYLAAELAAGRSPREAVAVATVAAGLSTTRAGAVSAIPRRDEVDAARTVGRAR